MTNPKVALAMICGCSDGEDKILDRALTSIAKHVDGVFITLTRPKNEAKLCADIAKKHGAHVFYGEYRQEVTQKQVDWLTEFLGYEPHSKVGDTFFRFDNARNASFANVPQEYDWIMWLDTDDVVLGADNIKDIACLGSKDGVEAFYFNYLYQVETDEVGRIKHILIKHLRERLVRNTGVYKWVAPIHETLIEQKATTKVDSYLTEVVHLATDKDRVTSMMRNLTNLEFSIYDTEGKDPRPIYYLAKIYVDFNTTEANEKGRQLIMKYLTGENQSGWPDERAQAWEYMAELYRRDGQYNNAVKACMNGLIEVPDISTLYMMLALIETNRNDWEKSLFWLKMSTGVPEKKTTLVSNPKDVETKTLEILFNASLNTNKLDNAWVAINKLKELHDNNPSIEESYNFVARLRKERDLTKNMMEIADFLKQSGEYPKIKALLASAPQLVQNNPFYHTLYQQNNPPRAWENDEIAIYCGMGFTPWGPSYMRNPQGTFMGGSEEAVVKVCEALATRGWKVTVYNDCGADEGEHNGVTYKPYYAFNRMDNFNILIAWRDIRFFDTKFSAKKTYLWNHDIQNPLDYTPERVDNITKAMFLSQWHRENVPGLSDEKVFLTTNGI